MYYKSKKDRRRWWLSLTRQQQKEYTDKKVATRRGNYEIIELFRQEQERSDNPY
jgi:DNA-binding MarR family transcriptional regulator